MKIIPLTKQKAGTEKTYRGTIKISRSITQEN